MLQVEIKPGNIIIKVKGLLNVRQQDKETLSLWVLQEDQDPAGTATHTSDNGAKIADLWKTEVAQVENGTKVIVYRDEVWIGQDAASLLGLSEGHCLKFENPAPEKPEVAWLVKPADGEGIPCQAASGGWFKVAAPAFGEAVLTPGQARQDFTVHAPGQQNGHDWGYMLTKTARG